MPEYFETVKRILSEQLKIEADSVTEDSLILEELGADSLDAVDMLMQLEEETGIAIADEDAENFRTPADIVHYLENAFK